MTNQTNEELLAIKFHDTYERLAPDFGYETRDDTKNFDPQSKNGKLMIAVCKEILDWHNKAISDVLDKVNAILDKEYVWCNEDGSYQYDPSGNQTIDNIRAELAAIQQERNKLKEQK